jgi:hypothetical protein
MQQSIRISWRATALTHLLHASEDGGAHARRQATRGRLRATERDKLALVHCHTRGAHRLKRGRRARRSVRFRVRAEGGEAGDRVETHGRLGVERRMKRGVQRLRGRNELVASRVWYS